MNYFQISEVSGEPKYKQLIRSIEKLILNGQYKRGDKLPSINGIKMRFSLSRDTVLLAYSNLKSRGIIQSIPGKGYYVRTENVGTVQKILLLFDEFNSFKEDLYNSFLNNLKEGVEVDIYFHHFNETIFSKLIFDNIGVYNTYIIMPANLKNVSKVLDNLPKDSVYILDQTYNELEKYPSIVQDFKKDIFDGLTEADKKLKAYKKLVLLYAENKQPKKMSDGFVEFCEKVDFDFEIIKSFDNRELEKGEVYLIPDDRNLIRIIKKIKEKKIVLGNDIGIISYNDTLLKEIVEGGITTISTDFKKMGATLATMILKNEKKNIHNPSRLIFRNSL
jgi:DNA-binding transcriptional regulator YhcF (GntR family)